MESTREKYENLRKTIMILGALLLVMILLFVVAFYKGWLGAPGEIYLSPESSEYYIRCETDPSICGNDYECKQVIITAAEEEIVDKLCMKE
jgi:hypothetical protein